MIIEDEMTIRRKKVKVKDKKTGEKKEYSLYFVVFSIEYNDILGKVKTLKNVEIVTKDKRYFVNESRVYKHSDYKRKNGERVPLYAIVIPKKKIVKELLEKGIRKVRIIAEVPEISDGVPENKNDNKDVIPATP